MIKEASGSVFSQGAGIICHQVNCRGVMGSGLAREVRKRISGREYEKYRDLCGESGALNLGNVLFCPALEPKGAVIANCFAQDGCGHFGCLTDYKALRKCMETVKLYADVNGIRTIAVPDHLGCGLAGGDWHIVKDEILYPVFEDADMTLIIAKI